MRYVWWQEKREEKRAHARLGLLSSALYMLYWEAAMTVEGEVYAYQHCNTGICVKGDLYRRRESIKIHTL
ncbi:hypothetical protein KSC_097930 [Ktedonobacter sp. SOSP1-52]|nr:hypothetical protein KSC_097930 [Ktedonobacter sp. SOSP1-52]